MASCYILRDIFILRDASEANWHFLAQLNKHFANRIPQNIRNRIIIISLFFKQ